MPTLRGSTTVDRANLMTRREELADALAADAFEALECVRCAIWSELTRAGVVVCVLVAAREEWGREMNR